jgi:hypothetical protein
MRLATLERYYDFVSFGDPLLGGTTVDVVAASGAVRQPVAKVENGSGGKSRKSGEQPEWWAQIVKDAEECPASRHEGFAHDGRYTRGNFIAAR